MHVRGRRRADEAAEKYYKQTLIQKVPHIRTREEPSLHSSGQTLNFSGRKAFCDTSFFFGSLMSEDANYEQAGEILGYVRELYYTLYEAGRYQRNCYPAQIVRK